MTEGEMAGETMEEKKKTEPILPPDIQRLIDEIEGVIPPERKNRKKDLPVRADGWKVRAGIWENLRISSGSMMNRMRMSQKNTG